MRLALLVTPFSDQNLQLAAQVGAEEIVCTYPGLDPAALRGTRERVESFGMRLGVVERLVPTLRFVHGWPGWEAQTEGFVALVRNLGEAGVPVLCYSWMPDDDWQRTAVDVPERGGALVTALDLGGEASVPNPTGHAVEGAGPTSAERLWENLERFLERVVPVAEQSGVQLAMHPDDPPVAALRGQARIMHEPEHFERLFRINDSPANGMCLCQGSFASSAAGHDIPDLIRRFAGRVRFAHFRDVVGAVPSFRESFHDNGKTDMPACMEAYYAAGIDCPIRPDHAPTLAGESNATPGYHMLGRLYAAGYMRGLMQCAARSGARRTLPP